MKSLFALILIALVCACGFVAVGDLDPIYGTPLVVKAERHPPMTNASSPQSPAATAEAVDAEVALAPPGEPTDPIDLAISAAAQSVLSDSK